MISRENDLSTTNYTINNGDPADQVNPPTPTGFRAFVFESALQINIRLQVDRPPRHASLKNPAGFLVSTARFYFVPATLAPIPIQNTPQSIADAFAKSSLVVELSALRGATYTFPASQFPAGSYFATFVNQATLGGAESDPAGPITIDQNAVQSIEDSVPPPDVSLVSSPFLVPLAVPMTTLKYWNVVFQLLAPSPPDSFDGVTIWTYGYFENVTATNVLVESAYYKYVITDPQIPSLGMTVKLPFLGDYDSTSSEPGLNVPHPVTFYFVAESKGHTYLPPVTSRPQFTFTNGIGA